MLPNLNRKLEQFFKIQLILGRETLKTALQQFYGTNFQIPVSSNCIPKCNVRF